MPSLPLRPLRLLIVLPSWVGDAAMATPTLRMIRAALPGVFIGALVRPGIDELLDGCGFFDEVHVARSSGIMGPKFVAAKVRPRRYDTALLLTNSFSTALMVRIAGIPRRIGYDRDARGLLLTHSMRAPLRADGSFAPVPAVDYYHALAERFLLSPARGATEPDTIDVRPLTARPFRAFLELGVTPPQQAAADAILERAGIAPGQRFAILNPGGNNEAKRWPMERFAALADHLHACHGLAIVINGSPGEAALVDGIAAACASTRPARLSALGITLGALKDVVARASIMVTNDTGPRHIAAAMGVPLVSLFGPTDHRWTTIPTRAGEALILADPTLPEDQLANDHPERCAIGRISLDDVVRACDGLLGGHADHNHSSKHA
jgi:heptosyltransferase II